MNKKLLMIPSVPVWKKEDSFVFDRKFYDGMLMYQREWNGILGCIMRSSKSHFPPFGTICKKENEIPFELIVLSKKEKITSSHLNNASIVVAPGDDFGSFHLSKLCKKNEIKSVYAIEYIPETRYRIIDFETRNPILRLRRKFYIWNGERKRIAAFHEADGLQINGTAAFEEYKRFKNCMLYFDTRINREIMISNEELESRTAKLFQKRSLHLAFSGRLIAMKGADHLVNLAAILKKRNIEFQLSIYGAGNLEKAMREMITNMQLDNEVKMRGAVGFYETLIPEIKDSVDLYVLLHRQSDPSSTYLETLSCGIPIVGYKNKAFSGILKLADVGWGREIDDLKGIADIIEHLHSNREQIKQKSNNCVNFSRLHDFETTFKNRIKHLEQIAE